MADRIELMGLKFNTCHGVLPEEKTTPQTFVVDCVLWLEFAEAAATDDIADTISYVDVAETVRDVVEGETRNLIETLATEIADKLMAHFGQLHACEVVVHKPQAPIGFPFADVRVVARRSRKRHSQLRDS